MHTLAVVSMLSGLIGFSILLFAKSFPMMIVYAVIFGISMRIQFIAIGNLYPDYSGVSEFAKIMGYTMLFNTFISAHGAPVAGYIRNKTVNYVPAFRVLIVLLAISFFCILLCKAAGSSFTKRQSEGTGTLSPAGELGKQELSTLCPMP